MHVSTLLGKVNLTGNAFRGRYPLEKDLYICKKIRVVWDARAYGLRIFICEEPWGAR